MRVIAQNLVIKVVIGGVRRHCRGFHAEIVEGNRERELRTSRDQKTEATTKRSAEGKK